MIDLQLKNWSALKIKFPFSPGVEYGRFLRFTVLSKYGAISHCDNHRRG